MARYSTLSRPTRRTKTLGELVAAERKRKLKDKGDGFFGLGFGPDVALNLGGAVSEFGHGIAGLTKEGLDITGNLGVALGLGLRNLVYGGTNVYAGKTAGEALSQAGAKSRLLGGGLLSSMAGTARTATSTLEAIPGLGAGLRAGYNLIGEGAAELAGAEGAARKAYQPKSLWERTKERGFAPALLEDIGNVAIGASLAKGAMRGASAATRAVGATEKAARLSGAAERITPFQTPIRELYKRTGKQVALAARQRTLAEATPVDDLVREFYTEAGQAYGMPEPKHGVPLREYEPHAGRSRKVAEAYDRLPLKENTPEARLAYDKLADELLALKAWIEKKHGIKFEVVDAKDNPYMVDGKFDPVETPRRLAEDVEQNRHMYVDRTGSFGESHPYLTPEQNDVFRAVHDYMGHLASKAGFDSAGEDLAYRYHAQFHSPEARRALASEQRGQDKVLRVTGSFPVQKAALLPKGMEQPDYLGPAAPWATKLVARMNPEGRIVRTLSAIEARAQVHQRKVELRRDLEAARNATMKSDAYRHTVDLALDLLAKTGRTYTRAEVDALLGDELRYRMTIGKVLDDVPPEILMKIHARHTKFPEDVLTPELDARLNAVVEEWKAQNQQVLDTYRADPRLGDRGLENVESSEVVWTKKEKRLIARVRADLQAAVRARNRAEVERQRAVDRISQLDDEATQLADRALKQYQQGFAGQRKFERQRATLARVFRSDVAWNRAMDVIADATLENEGATFNPHTGKLETPVRYGGTDVGWAVAYHPGTALPVPLDQFTANPRFWLDAFAKQYQDVLSHPDARIGTEIVDDVVNIDVSHRTLTTSVNGQPVTAPLTRDQAIALGIARGQERIFDFETGQTLNLLDLGYRRDIVAQFIKQHGNRDRIARDLRRMADDPLKHRISHDDVDHVMGLYDTVATAISDARPNEFPHPDDVYRTFRFQNRRKWSADMPHGLKQVMATVAPDHPSLRKAFLRKLRQMPNFEKAMRWYWDSHNAIENKWRGKEVTLLNGEKIDAADLMYQLIAVTSIRAVPVANMGNALAALRNLLKMQNQILKEADLFMRLLKKHEATTAAKGARGAGPRNMTELFKMLGKDTQMFSLGQEAVFDILTGHTLDKWTPEFIATRGESFGHEVKSFMVNKKAMAEAEQIAKDQGISLDQALIERAGSRGWAKVMAYWNNLKDPANATWVTLDGHMANHFGVDWNNLHTYNQFSEALRKLTRVWSEELGREVVPHEIQAAIWVWIKSEAAREAGGQLSPELANQVWSLDDVLTGPNPRVQRMLDDLEPFNLAQKFQDEVLGLTSRSETGRAVLSIFDNADATTLIHEFTHAMRPLLPEDDLRILEKHYGVSEGKYTFDVDFVNSKDALKNKARTITHRVVVHAANALEARLLAEQMVGARGVEVVETRPVTAERRWWSESAEEMAANDFMTYLNTGRAPKGMESVFTRIRQVLKDLWDHARELFGRRLDPEIAEVWERLLSPAERPITDLGVPGQKLEKGSPRQRATNLGPNVGAVTPKEAYRLGYRSARALEQSEAAFGKMRDALIRRAKVQAEAAELRQVLTENALPSALKAAALDARAAKTAEQLATSLDDPSVARVPRAWRPLWNSIQELAKEAETNSEIADLFLEDRIPYTFRQVLQRANELGFDPTYVADFTPSQVRQLAVGALRLGPADDLGKEVIGKGRRRHKGVLQRAGLVDHSINALAVSMVEAVRARNSNALVDFIEQNIAVPIQTGEVIPKGWVEWDPARRFLLTGEQAVRGEPPVTVAGPGTKLMVPKAVSSYLRRMVTDYNHPVFRAIGKVTDPWRALVLTLSPRWYVNNVFGNMLLATLEGVKLADWKKAWHEYKTGYQNTPQVLGHAIVSELGLPHAIPRSRGFKGLREAFREGGIGEMRREAGTRIRRLNEAVDEFSRAAVYHKTLRTTGDAAKALNRAYEALVDYNNLSPFERAAVRSVIPFYAWQKGILKIASRLPVDHPAVMGIMMMFGRIQERDMRELFGTQPPGGYLGLLPVGGGGFINTRSLNPFVDAKALITPEGIAQSMNPFIEILARKGLHATGTTFSERVAVNEYGTSVQDLSIPEELVEDVGANIPLAALGLSLTGHSPMGAGQTALRFAGVPYLNPDQIAKAIERNKKARVMAGLDAPVPKGVPAGLRLPTRRGTTRYRVGR